MSKFKNVNPNKKHKTFIDLIKWKLCSKKKKWPSFVPIHTTDYPPPRVKEQDKVRISFVGHVSFLIQTSSLNILTDPIWSERASPSQKLGPKRVSEPGIPFNALPPIDAVIISHNHYDHMDITTIKNLWHQHKPQIIVPLKNDEILKAKIPKIEVTTLNWGEGLNLNYLIKSEKANNSISIHLEPSQHWSARGLFDQNQALWGTFIIKTPIGSICFIGDSGYDPSIFKEIGRKFDPMLVSLIPIGAYEPRWFMQDVHMNPEESILVHQDLGSRNSIASHFDTFPLADDDFKQAVTELEIARNKYNIKEEDFIIPKIGGVYWFDDKKNRS